jgi:hypothetical protein
MALLWPPDMPKHPQGVTFAGMGLHASDTLVLASIGVQANVPHWYATTEWLNIFLACTRQPHGKFTFQ